MPFIFHRLKIPQVILVEAQAFEDSRGLFIESYRQSDFAANGIPEVFVQDNYSHSRRGALRGLHYQKHPRAQGKLVMVLEGEIFDVAVDIRKGSPTHGQWVGKVLSHEKREMLYVPVGFAHGFCVLSESAGVLYKVTEEYTPDLERGIVWNDAAIAIPWPVTDPVLSPRDAQFPLLRDSDRNFIYEGTHE